MKIFLYNSPLKTVVGCEVGRRIPAQSQLTTETTTNSKTALLGGVGIDNHQRWFRQGSEKRRDTPHAGRVTQSLSLSSASAAALDENFQCRNPNAKLHGQLLLPQPASPLQRFAVLN